MDAGITKLLKFLDHADDDCHEFFGIALSSFFEDIIAYSGDTSLQEIQEQLGEEVFDVMYPCALEFFFSNEYPSPDGSGGTWNIIDVFLAKKGSTLSAGERSYLTALRDSYMSVYEVIDVKPEESLTLRDMVQGGNPITISEKLATHSLVKWDRMVKEEKGVIAAGGAILLSHETADTVIADIKKISSALKKFMTARELKKQGLTAEQADRLQKKLWCKEIAAAFVEDQLSNPPDLVNNDGDKLQYCRVEFSVLKNKRRTVEILDTLPELVEDDEAEDDGAEDAWLWPMLEKDSQNKKIANDNVLCIETQVQNLQNNQLYIIFAQMRLSKKTLVIQVNSRQRANILQDYIKTHLGDLVDDGIIHLEDMDKLKKSPAPPSLPKGGKKKPLAGSEKEMLHQMKEAYYHDWIDVPVPMLGNITPRQASKTKAGREKLIDLLKYLQNSELRQVRGEDEPPYDFSWIWEELNLKEAA